jgi:hypothetical protein
MRCRVYLSEAVPPGKLHLLRYGAWGRPAVKVNPRTDLAGVVNEDTVRWG